MSRLALLVVLAPLSATGAPGEINEQSVLVEVDCTANYHKWLDLFGLNPLPRDAVPVGTDPESRLRRQRLIVLASRWALSEGYLPCTFTMTGCVLVDRSGAYGVYIGPFTAQVEKEPGIYPEAAVFFRGDTEAIEEVIIYHSSCRKMRQAAVE